MEVGRANRYIFRCLRRNDGLHVSKKKESDLADTLIRNIADTFHQDWESFIRVEVNDQLNGYINRVVERYPLIGLDTIHLASAIVIHERIPEDFVFSCFDDRLARAAQSEGLEIFPEGDKTN